jgi:hypothetical protein
MTRTRSTTTIARARSVPHAEKKVKHARQLTQQLYGPVRVLVWAGLLALYTAPCRADNWSSAPPMPTARKTLAAATGPDGTIYGPPR